jgi:hypothetical protein
VLLVLHSLLAINTILGDMKCGLTEMLHDILEGTMEWIGHRLLIKAILFVDNFITLKAKINEKYYLSN